jgi:hypothetical protein
VTVSERRDHIRATFSPARRPRLALPDGTHDVLDASVVGLRLRHTDPVRPAVGTRVAGTLRFPDLRPSLALRGVIVRVAPADIAIACEDERLPVAWIMAEAARRRDTGEYDFRSEGPRLLR